MDKVELVKVAKKLAERHASAEPNLRKVYLFPADDRIDLVEVDPTTTPSEEGIEPYYFLPDAQNGIPLPSGVALILPDEEGELSPPEGWVSWDEAILVWERKSNGER